MQGRRNSLSICYDCFRIFILPHLPSKIKIHKTITAPFVFEGCQTVSLLLREEHGIRVLNKVLREIFGPKLGG